MMLCLDQTETYLKESQLLRHLSFNPSFCFEKVFKLYLANREVVPQVLDSINPC